MHFWNPVDWLRIITVREERGDLPKDRREMDGFLDVDDDDEEETEPSDKDWDDFLMMKLKVMNNLI